MLHEVDDFFESQPMSDVSGRVLTNTVVSVLALSIDTLDRLDDDCVVCFLLFDERVID